MCNYIYIYIYIDIDIHTYIGDIDSIPGPAAPVRGAPARRRGRHQRGRP